MLFASTSANFTGIVWPRFQLEPGSGEKNPTKPNSGATNVTVLSVLVEALLPLPNSSCAAPAGIDATTVAEALMPVTEMV
jgi:hypothetical protein